MKLNLNKLASLFVSVVAVTSTAAFAKAPVKQLSSPADAGIVNQERIEYWLKKRGEILPNASKQQIKNKIDGYTQKARAYVMPEYLADALDKANKRVNLKGVSNKSSGVAKTVKILAVMIDFPDLPFDDNRLTSSDTGMYYASYPVSHYHDLMFSTTGFDGPSNQNLLSAYQYYQSESGGDFFYTGDSYGWVTADNDAATYGGNDANNDDSDLDVPSLVKEAVTKAVAANSINLADYDIEDPFDLDGDGNINEPDGFIDHVNIFHSSVGEEAGGGVLAADAIWSHRFFVNSTGDTSTMGYEIPGTGIKVFGYTVEPIDAAAGVVAHEFGHDLGLPDLYDTGTADKGSPVGFWSIMSGGSWGGALAGSKPTGFSTYGRSFLQEKHGGSWINEQTVDLTSLQSEQTINLVEATNHTAGSINQVKVTLPLPKESFANPYTDSYQYYSDRGNDLNNTLSFSLTLPNSDNLQLAMKARWDIEKDWDFARVLINGVAIVGNHTSATNPYTGQYGGYEDANNYISDKSASLAGAEGPDGWVDLTFDVSAYKGQTVTVKFEYRTDSNTGGYGFVADDIQLLDGSNQVYFDGAETANTATLSGFQRISNKRDGKPQNYWIQLRSYASTDNGLADENYDDGLVIWFADTQYSGQDGNQSSVHPGHGLVGVVDANQNLIGSQSSSVQVRDAAFGTNGQAAAIFNDSLDYSSPSQPESGIILPLNGLKIEVSEMAADSSTATIKISKLAIAAQAAFSYSVSGTSVSFTDDSSAATGLTYSWNFGDASPLSTEQNPVHNYATEGVYNVSLTVTDQDSNTNTTTSNITVGTPVNSAFTTTLNVNVLDTTNTSTGGIGDVSYSWDFGDGMVSTEVSPSHTYTSAGDFTLTLTATDSVGSNVSTSNLSIGEVLAASFTSSIAEKTATFTNNSSGGLGDLTYSWDFGDGNSATDSSPVHSYAQDGSYSVVLTVTDGYDNTNQIAKTVSINTQPPSSGDSSGGGGPLGLFWLVALAGLFRKRSQLN